MKENINFDFFNLINSPNIEVSVLHEACSNMNIVDIADAFLELTREKAVQVFRLLSKDIASEVFAYIAPEKQQIIIEALSENEAAKIIEDLYVDDATDFLEEMPPVVVNRVLKRVNEETRRIINQLLNYPEDSAGSIMTTEYVELSAEMTVKQAFDIIRATGVDKETIYTCYVVKEDRTLIGEVSAETLLFSELDKKIGDIMEDNFVFAYTLDDQEKLIAQFKKYSLLALPIVDNEKKLVGIVTVDDIVIVIEQESTEDFHIMAAITPSDEPYLKTSVFKLAKNRFPWLLILMLSAMLTAGVISGFERSLVALPILMSFIPMIMGAGGNAGAQSSTVVVRGLAIGEIEKSDTLRVLGTELGIGFICGIVLAVVNFLRVLILNSGDIMLSLTVSLALFITLLLAKTCGAILPITAKALKLDPAVMAAPLITTIVDVLALLVYFSFANLILLG